MRKLQLVGFFMLLSWGFASAQVYISKYLPGNYLADNRHEINLYNPGLQDVSLANYLLVTRDYSVRFPKSARIPAGATFRIRKKRKTGEPFDLELARTPDFLIRFHDRSFEGNYAVLYDYQMKIRDAMYFAPLREVPFIPDEDTCITFKREYIPYSIPPETRSVWSYLSMGDDPAIAFIQKDGSWQLTSARNNMEPATAYGNFSLRYEEGVVGLRWSTRFEEEAREHVVERSKDQQSFTEVGKVRSQGNGQEIRQYSFYETNLAEGERFYYRIKNEDPFGNVVYSKIRAIETKEGPESFALNVFLGKQSERQELNVRFFSRYNQRVRIRVFNQDGREMCILFDDYVYGGSRNLLKTGRPLPPGKYLVLADTETERFGKEIELLD